MYVFCYRPVHGLIFLFKWQPGEEPAGSIVQDSRLDHIFFAKQVLLASQLMSLGSFRCIWLTIFTAEAMHFPVS